MPQPETRFLVEEASRGDAEAVESLLARYMPGLERYVRRHAGGVVADRESGSDLVQSVCREVLQQLAQERFEYRGERQFLQWLHRVALHKIQNRARYWRAEMRDADRDVPAAAATGGASREDAFFLSLVTPSQEAGLREELERARAVFERLPESYREIITLAEFEGLSHREIAERLEISEAYSRTLLSRALARLARLGADG